MLRYGGPFLFLIALPILDARDPFYGLLVIPSIIAALLAGGSDAARVADTAAPRSDRRAIPRLFVMLVMVLLLWGMQRSTAPGLGAGEFLARAVAIAAICGIFGLVAAHEMIHSGDRRDQFCGQALLALLSYRHSHIAHLYGHHRYAATPLDPSTARRGESSYRFLARTIIEQWRFAWRFEQRRLAGKPRRWVRHRCRQDIAIGAALYLPIVAILGWRAGLLLALVSAISIVLLEMFNYVAHYGMARRWDASGSREPLQPYHSWNTRGGIANGLLFNMGRHSDHHRRAQAAYFQLRPDPKGPLLPGGYAGAVLLALIPPLWRRCMDRRLDTLDAQRAVVS